MTLSAPPAASAAAVRAAAAAGAPPRPARGGRRRRAPPRPGRYFHSPSVQSRSAPGAAWGERDDLRLGVSVRAEPAGDGVGPDRGDGRIQRPGRGGSLGGVVRGQQPGGLGGARFREPVGAAVAHPADGEHAAGNVVHRADQRARRRLRGAARHERGGRGRGGGHRRCGCPLPAAGPPRQDVERGVGGRPRGESDDRVDDTPSQTAAATGSGSSAAPGPTRPSATASSLRGRTCPRSLIAAPPSTTVSTWSVASGRP